MPKGKIAGVEKKSKEKKISPKKKPKIKLNITNVNAYSFMYCTLSALSPQNIDQPINNGIINRQKPTSSIMKTMHTNKYITEQKIAVRTFLVRSNITQHFPQFIII